MEEGLTLIDFLMGRYGLEVVDEKEFNKLIKYFSGFRIDGSRALADIGYEYFSTKAEVLGYNPNKMCFVISKMNENDPKCVFTSKQFINRYVKGNTLTDALDILNSFDYTPSLIFAAHEIRETHPELSNSEIEERANVVVDVYLHSDESDLVGLCQFVNNDWNNVKQMSKSNVLDTFNQEKEFEM